MIAGMRRKYREGNYDSYVEEQVDRRVFDKKIITFVDINEKNIKKICRNQKKVVILPPECCFKVIRSQKEAWSKGRQILLYINNITNFIIN